MKPGLFVAAVLAAFAVGIAVGRLSTSPSASPAPVATSMPADHPPMAAPPAAMPPAGAPGPSQGEVAGTVAEIIQVSNYTYLRLSTPAGDQWAAVTSTQDVQQGQAVHIVAATEMAGFFSKTLNRTFDVIWFGQLGGGEPSAGSAAALPPGHPTTTPPTSAAAAAVAAVAASDAPLTLRVADIFSEKQALEGKRVRVSGKVSKATSVQGVWYVHLQEGSNDLPVLMSSEAKVDATVTVEGLVALNKDVGMGSPYPVVLDKASAVP